MHHSERDEPRISDNMKELMKSLPVKNLADRIEEEARKMGLGATGNFPEGKIAEHDEGEIKIAIGIHEGKVIISFGKAVTWLGFDAKQARQIAESLRQQSYKLEKLGKA